MRAPRGRWTGAARAGVSALGAIAALLLLVVAGVVVSVVMFVRGTAGLDDWVVRQVVTIANTYLTPEIAFETFDYDYPATLTLQGVTFTSPQGARVIDARGLQVTLAERPRRGEPIRIERVDLLSPTLHLIEERDEQGLRFQGLVPFVDRDPIRRPETVDENVRLSTVLELRRIVLRDGALTYEPSSGDPPMRLSGIELDLEIDPEAESTPAGEVVWHSVDADITRAPIFDLSIDGRFSLDTLVAQIADLSLDMRVASDTLESLPPALQQFLRSHDAHGDLSAHASGTYSVRRLADSDLDLHASLGDFNVAVGQYRLPITRGVMTASITDGRVSLSALELDALRGAVTVRGEADLNERNMPGRLEWSVRKARLRDLERTTTPEGQPPLIAGVVDGGGTITGDLANLPRSLQGPGELHIKDGRLVIVPLVRALAHAANALSKLTGGGALQDRFDAEFHFQGEGVELDSFELITPALGALGSGTVTYGGDLDLVVSAGPVRRITSLLGKVGNVLSDITGGLVRYRVRGQVADPKVTVHPLGLGAARNRTEVRTTDVGEEEDQ